MRHPERPCTTCMGRGERVVATHVAGDATGLEWFECDRGHTITDNLARTIRTRRVPDRRVVSARAWLWRQLNDE